MQGTFVMNSLPPKPAPRLPSAISDTAKRTLENALPLEQADAEEPSLRSRFAELKRRAPNDLQRLSAARKESAKRRKRRRGSKDTDGTLSASALSRRIQTLLKKADATSSPNVDVLTIVVTKTNRGKVRAFGTPKMQWLWNQLAVQDVFRKLYPSPRYAQNVFPDAFVHDEKIQQQIDRAQMPAPSERSRPKSAKRARPVIKKKLDFKKRDAQPETPGREEPDSTTTTTTTTTSSSSNKKQKVSTFEELVY